MFKTTRKSRLVKVAAAAAAIGSLAAIGFAGSSPANADPKQYSALIGYGSDTTQDIMNALAGDANGIAYIPVKARDAAKTQLVSWDAFPANQCITVKVGSPQILRPNGSTNGRRILSRAFGGGTWGNAACGNRDVSGTVDFARSSSGPSAVGTDLVYIPFGRDALTYAWSKPTATPAPVTNITPLDLTSLMANGPKKIGDTVVIPCGIQTGSGTYQSWNTMHGLATTAGADTGTGFCNTFLVAPLIPAALAGRLQESNGPQLKLKADQLALTSNPICDGVAGGEPVSCANAQVIVGFSASQFIARTRNVAAPNPGPGVALGAINGLDPINGTSPNLTADPLFYADGTYGRNVYNVLSAESVADTSNVALQTMFIGNTSAICQASATIATFGFLPLGSACGSTILTGLFEA